MNINEYEELGLNDLNNIGYVDNNKMRLDSLDIIKIKNIVPYESLIGGLSGAFKLNFERERFDAKSNKIFPNIVIPF